jgi:competence protein ComEC
LPIMLYTPQRLAQAQFRLSVLDVGQGLAVLIQTRDHALLFDTGQPPNMDRVLLPSLRHFGVAKLDTLLLSHNDNDHIGGAAALLQRWPVAQIRHSLPARHPLLQQQKSQQACQAGQTWQWDGVVFSILWPPANHAASSDNAQGCVLRVSNAHFSALLTADIGRNEEADLLSTGLARSDIVVVPHHGSKSSSSTLFVSRTQPQFAVFSAGFMNRFAHPNPTIVDRYRAIGAQILRTDELGAVQFTLGDHIFLQSARETAPHYWYTTMTSKESSE